jgi:hypothetical protein
LAQGRSHNPHFDPSVFFWNDIAIGKAASQSACSFVPTFSNGIIAAFAAAFHIPTYEFARQHFNSACVCVDRVANQDCGNEYHKACSFFRILEHEIVLADFI